MIKSDEFALIWLRSKALGIPVIACLCSAKSSTTRSNARQVEENSISYPKRFFFLPTISRWTPTARLTRAASRKPGRYPSEDRSEEHTSELQSHHDLVCRLLLEKKNKRQ